MSLVLGVFAIFAILGALAYFGDTEFHSQQRLQRERLKSLSDQPK